MAQDMILDRVELAQPHECSWPAAPYHANKRKSIQHKKNEALTPRHRDSQYQCFSIMFFLSHKSCRIGVFIKKKLVKKKVLITFFLSHKSRPYNRGMAQDMIFNRVELAQPHEYSWQAAPYHANILISTCPLRTNSDCGKREAHINWSMVTCKLEAPVTGTTLTTTGPVPADSRQ